MYRFAMEKLLKWKDSKHRKPLIIEGARQVGKTWLMQEFGKQAYTDTVYINFDSNPQMTELFANDLNTDRLIMGLELFAGRKINPDNSLLIFDEVQEVPRALTSLKYFYENAPQYAIMAAGSLLGVALHQGTSFPVGKVDFMHLYPLNFYEFICAMGDSQLAQLLESGDYEMMNAFSTKYTELLKKYYYIGGMPEVVQTFIDTDDFYAVREVQKNLLKYYEEDFSKHAPKEVVPRIMMVWNSIPSQLAKENRKFIYGCMREGARAKDFELAIQWLEDAGLIIRSYRITKPDIPLIAYMEMNSFKMFTLDVGLLGAKANIHAKVLLDGCRIFEEFKGALTEQFVAQQLKASDRELYYYSTENSSGEIDFVIQQEMLCVPIEVKAEENLRARSLRAFCEKYKPEIAIRSSMSNYREQDWMVNVPLYVLDQYLEKQE